MFRNCFKPIQCSVIQGFVRATFVDCLYVQNWRQIVRADFSHSIDEMSGLDLSAFGTSKKMVCPFGNIPFFGFLPMMSEFLVFHGSSFCGLYEYKGYRLDIFRFDLGPDGTPGSVTKDHQRVPLYVFLIVRYVDPVAV